MLFSRQSTLDDLDGPETVPKTSERARPRLRKMFSMDMSSSSADSGSLASRCLPHACFVPEFYHFFHLHVIANISACDVCFVLFCFLVLILRICMTNQSITATRSGP